MKIASVAKQHEELIILFSLWQYQLEVISQTHLTTEFGATINITIPDYFYRKKSISFLGNSGLYIHNPIFISC